uniref:DUF4492 domain-containing protein n=1 Tax=uncultured Campylobacter sp. TaxID=218934 RepID=UPI0025EDBEBE
NILNLYVDGFKNMKVGRRLWLIILVKLLIMFGILKVFFFNETLNTKFTSDEQKSDFVIENLTDKAK